MGSTNFKTVQVIRPTFAVEADDEYDHDDAGYPESFMTDLFEEAKRMAEEIELPFHTIEVEAGYDSGFQIYLERGMSAKGVAENLSIAFDDDEPYLTFLDYHGYEKDDIDFYSTGAAIAEPMKDWRGYDVFDADGERAYHIVTNESAMEELIQAEEAIAFHHLAVMAQKLGLAPIVGDTWTSSVERDFEAAQKEIARHIIPELLNESDESDDAPAYASPRG